jgi:large subunit ribosomal protein L1
MGKIRVNTIGDEQAEAQQKVEAEKRRAAKKAEKTEEKVEKGTETAETPEEPKKKVMKKKVTVTKARSPRYSESSQLRDKSKMYSLSEALDVLEKMKRAKFDETVELHINTIDKLNGNVVLPNGTGKQTKVAILAPAKDSKAADELLKKIEAGKIEFDVLVATPDAMPRLAKVARVLGPKGLMPNPKNGTVTPRPEEVAEKFKGGQVNFKTEAKANVIHVVVGKMSFGKTKLSANISTLLGAVDSTKVKSLYLKSTMSPSLKLVK